MSAAPDRRLFLHIGTHKTGSSAFQEAAWRNRGRLRRQGWFLAANPHRPPGRNGMNRAGIAHLFIRDQLQTGPRIKGGFVAPDASVSAERRREFARHLGQVPQENVLLSAEAFCFLRTDEEAAAMRAFLIATGRRIVVLVVFRELESWRRSWRGFLGRSDRIAPVLADLPQAARPDGAWYFDHQAIAEFWQRVLRGIGELRVIAYEPAMATHGTIVTPLFQAMGCDSTGFETMIFRKVSPK